MLKLFVISFLIPFISHVLFMRVDYSVVSSQPVRPTFTDAPTILLTSSPTLEPTTITKPVVKKVIVPTPRFYDPFDLLTVVSKNNSIASFLPTDLKSLFALGYPTYSVRTVVYKDLVKMLSAAKAENLVLTVLSAYRSFDAQTQLFSDYSINYGEARANIFSAKPGYSEHQLGTTLDFSSPTRNGLVAVFGSDAEGIWLSQHAYEYGFTLSYPLDKVDITGYTYEPWHYRYVGVEMATYLFENKLVMQEFDFEVYK